MSWLRACTRLLIQELSTSNIVPYFLLSPLWHYVYTGIFGDNDFNISTYGTFVLSTATFWFWCCLFMYPDLTGKPEWLIKYKLQPGTNQPVDKTKLWRAVKQVLFNDFIVGIPFLGLFYCLRVIFKCPTSPQELPSIFRVILNYYGMYVFDEVWFYFTHRMLHWGPLYRRFHKLHHTWYSPISVTTSYSHPVEHVISNLIPICLGSVFVSAHLLEFWIWLVLYKFTTVFHHSGYNVPYMPNAEYHDYHHLKVNGNYGGGPLDRLLGTDLGVASKPNTKSKKL